MSPHQYYSENATHTSKGRFVAVVQSPSCVQCFGTPWTAVHQLACPSLSGTPWTATQQACLSLTISWSFPKKKVGAWKKSGSIKTAHFSQRNWVDIGNVHARHTHLLLHHCTLCHELYQNYSGEVCDKLETFDEFSVVIVVNYALHSKPHHWLQALHVTQPGDLGWFHMGAAW